MAAVAGTVLSVFGLLYARFLRYDHVALRHVPDAAVVAVRIDVTQAVFYDPVRRYALPLLGGLHASDAERERRLSAFERRSGLHRSDLREIVFARGLDPDDWILVFNGFFPSDPESRTLVRALSVEPGFRADADGHMAVFEPSGISAARTGDDTVLLASRKAWLVAAETPTDRAGALGMDPNGIGGFGMGPEELRRLATTPAVLASGDLPALFQKLTRVRGTFTIGEQVSLHVTFEAPDPDVARRAAAGTRGLLKAFSQQDRFAGAPLLHDGLERGRLDSRPDDVGLSLVWERIELDRGLSHLVEGSIP